MLRFLSISLFSLALLLLVSCEKESINITEEIPGSVDPVIVELEGENQGDIFFLQMPSGDTIELNGQGVIDEIGFVGLVTDDSSLVDCQGGIITFNLGRSERGFYLGLSTDPNLGQVVFVGGAFDLPGLIENNAAFIAPDCESQPAFLDIITLTEDRIAGVFASEFFTSSSGAISGCEDLTNLGLVKVVFNVALTTCE